MIKNILMQPNENKQIKFFFLNLHAQTGTFAELHGAIIRRFYRNITKR